MKIYFVNSFSKIVSEYLVLTNPWFPIVFWIIASLLIAKLYRKGRLILTTYVGGKILYKCIIKDATFSNLLHFLSILIYFIIKSAILRLIDSFNLSLQMYILNRNACLTGFLHWVDQFNWREVNDEYINDILQHGKNLSSHVRYFFIFWIKSIILL